MARIRPSRPAWTSGGVVGFGLAVAVMPGAFQALDRDALLLAGEGWRPLAVWGLPVLLLAFKVAMADTLGFGALAPMLLGLRCAVVKIGSALAWLDSAMVAMLGDLALYLREQRLQRDDRYAVQSAFDRALAAATTPRQVGEAADQHWPQVLAPSAADAASLGALALRLPMLPDRMVCDRTLIAPQPPGRRRVQAVRRLADGVIMALWHEPEQGFQRVVAYDDSGAAFWVYHWSLDAVSRSPQTLSLQPDRAGALACFVASCQAAAGEHAAIRHAMRRTCPGTHRLGGFGGVLTIRDHRGRLDNPTGLPAALAPDGTPLWALHGYVLAAPGPDARSATAPGAWSMGA